MAQFFETRMGKTYYESTLPRLAKALERIAAAMEDARREANKASSEKSGDAH